MWDCLVDNDVVHGINTKKILAVGNRVDQHARFLEKSWWNGWRLTLISAENLTIATVDWVEHEKGPVGRRAMVWVVSYSTQHHDIRSLNARKCRPGVLSAHIRIRASKIWRRVCFSAYSPSFLWSDATLQTGLLYSVAWHVSEHSWIQYGAKQEGSFFGNLRLLCQTPLIIHKAKPEVFPFHGLCPEPQKLRSFHSEKRPRLLLWRRAMALYIGRSLISWKFADSSCKPWHVSISIYQKFISFIISNHYTEKEYWNIDILK